MPQAPGVAHVVAREAAAGPRNRRAARPFLQSARAALARWCDLQAEKGAGAGGLRPPGRGHPDGRRGVPPVDSVLSSRTLRGLLIPMKRFALILVIFFGVAAGALYAFSDRIAGRVIERGIDRLVALAATRGVDLHDVRFESATLAGFGSVAAGRVKGEATLRRGLLDGGPESLFFEADRVSATVLDLLKGKLLMSARDGMIVMLDPAGQPTGQQISKLNADIEFDIAWRHLEDSALLVEEELRQLLREGSFRLPARISGEAQFQVLGKWHSLTIHSFSEDGVTRLHLEIDDVREIAKAYMLPLTEAEMELVSRNPVRAPALLRISQQAFAASQALRRKDPAYPYDAYRHVYWSWMLTRQFGAEFSEAVTDAHEIRPTYEVSEASRRMDLHNNAVGRAYALAGVAEGEIPQRVLTDPNVVRSEDG